ncbi:MAG: hypothetical protein ACYDCC_05425 [Actinomycetota bacterium]
MEKDAVGSAPESENQLEHDWTSSTFTANQAASGVDEAVTADRLAIKRTVYRGTPYASRICA